MGELSQDRSYPEDSVSVVVNDSPWANTFFREIQKPLEVDAPERFI